MSNKMAPIKRHKTIADQVLVLLRQRIANGYYGDENRIPSETELATELQVSRATIRTALSTLAAERLIFRRQGDGTYINRRVVDTAIHFGAIADFTMMIVANGHVPTIRLLSYDVRSSLDHESGILQIASHSEVVEMARLFLSDDIPAIYSLNVFPKDIIRKPIEDEDFQKPLPKFIKDVCKQEFTYAISNLCAEIIAPEIRRDLQSCERPTEICMKEIFYNDREQPLVIAHNYFNSAVLQLKVARSFN